MWFKRVLSAALLASLCVPRCVLAGISDVVDANFTTSFIGIDDDQPELQANRNGQVVCAFVGSAGYENSFLMAGPGIASPSVITLSPGVRSRFWELSNWGLAVSTDRDGSDPTGVYTTPIGGNNFASIGEAVFSPAFAGLNDSGTVVFTDRNSFQTLNNLLYYWQPGQSAAQAIPNVLPSNFLYYGQAQVDDNNVVNVIYQNQSSVPFVESIGRYQLPNGSLGAGGWTSLIMNPQGHGEPSLSPINLNGQSTYTSDGGNTVLAGPSSTTVIQSAQTGIQLSLNTLADNGAFLSINLSTNLHQPGTVTLIQPNGTSINAISLLPAGYTETVYDPDYSMNQLGQVLLEGQDTSTGLYSYFIYSNNTVTPLITEIPQAISPVLTDTDQMYYLTEQAGSYSLVEASAPEPAEMGLFVCSLVLLSRR
jgi:hypothetical protein